IHHRKLGFRLRLRIQKDIEASSQQATLILLIRRLVCPRIGYDYVERLPGWCFSRYRHTQSAASADIRRQRIHRTDAHERSRLEITAGNLNIVLRVVGYVAADAS